MSAQLPLALRVPPDQRFETFVGAVEGALPAVRALAVGTGDVDAVYLAGSASTGKSHLLLAACAAVDAAGRSARYVPLAAATGRVAAALDALDAHDLVALDDLHTVAGDREAEIAVFDVHNRVRDAGGRLLYAATAMPDGLPLALPDLRSRLSQCVRFVLDPLDDAGRRDMLLRRAARRGLQVDAAAIEWLLRRVDRDPARLAALFERLDRESLAAQRAITVPFLRAVLGAG